MSDTAAPISKSQAIRAYLAEHPDASTQAVVEALAAQGIQTARDMVCVMRDMMGLLEPRAAEPKMPPGHLGFGECQQFYKLYAALGSYANSKLNIVPETPPDPEQFSSLSPIIRTNVRDAVYAQPELIDQFVQENPHHLSAAELAIVAGWKHAVIGGFFVFRYSKQYAVFLTDKNPPKAYGVLALASPFEELVGPYLPVMVKGVLLPMNGRIIYDGLLESYSISFGPGIRKSLNKAFKQARESSGIITSLPEGSSQRAVKTKTTSLKKPAATAGPADVKAVLDTIVGMTDDFCRKHLNDEYAQLCRKLAASLARKRPSPLLRGGVEAWACGVIRTVGWVNFLDDPNQKPHMKLPVIDRAFGVAESTGQGKSRQIRKLLRIGSFDPKWTLPSQLDDNPKIWMVSVNGFVLDVRSAPRELQVQAYEAGLIPYVPADRDSR